MTDDVQSFFGLSRPPFGPITADGEIFRSFLVDPVVKEVLAGTPVLAVKGGPGVGKTAFMHALAHAFQARGLTAVMLGGHAPTRWDVQTLIEQAGGLGQGAMEPARLLRALWDQAGVKRVVVLCDNAETYPAETFEYLALLVKLRFSQPVRLQLILFGAAQPWPGLAHPAADEMRHATASRYITFSLRQDEAAAYLDHRLRSAGQPLRRIMAPSAVVELCHQAQCNPRRLDEMTLQALLHGYRTGRRRLTAGSVREALSPGSASPRERAARRTGRIALAATLLIGAVAVAGGLVIRRRGEVAGPASPVRVAAPRVVLATKPAAPLPAVSPPTPLAVAPAGAQKTAAPAGAQKAVAPAGVPVGPPTVVRPPTPIPAPQSPPVTITPPPVPHIPAPAPSPVTHGGPPPPAPPAQARSAPPPPAGQGPAATTPAPRTAVSTQAPGRRAGAQPPAVARPAPASSPASGSPAGPPGRPLPPLPQTLGTGGLGLVLIARPHDTLENLYGKVYAGVTPPPFAAVVAANKVPVSPGALLIFPEPPAGWNRRK